MLDSTRYMAERIRQENVERNISSFLVAAVANLFVSSAVLADSPVFPYTYAQVVPGEEFLFVMLAPDEDTYWLDDDVRAQRQEILETYPQSGLYRNDGSTEPLWTVDWYALSVDVASDGVHVVRHGPWANSTADDAVSFYANGELLQRYRIRNLVDNPLRLEYTISHFFWEQDCEFDEARLEYVIETIDGNRFVFDVRTGEIVTESRPGRLLLWSVSPAGAAAMPWMLHAMQVDTARNAIRAALKARSQWIRSHPF